MADLFVHEERLVRGVESEHDHADRQQEMSEHLLQLARMTGQAAKSSSYVGGVDQP